MSNLTDRLQTSDVAKGSVTVASVIVDRKRLWRNAGNVRYNAGIRSVLHLLAAPFAVLHRRRRTTA